MIRLHVADLSIDAAAPDQPPSRSITGLAVPWNVATTDSLGTRVLFEQNSLPEDGRAPKLVESHDLSKVIGLVTERASTDQGMMFTARIASTRAGDDALELLKMGALDAVSVGVEPVDYTFDQDGVMRVQSAVFHELSVVAVPAYDEARITSVAASAPDPEPEADEPEPQYPEPEEDSMSETPELVEASAPAAPIQFAEPKRALRLPSPGEYLSALKRGGSDFAQLNANIQRIAAATGDVVVSDAGGVVPVPILGPVIQDIDARRPIVSALGTRGMPDAGATFIRPYVKVHSSVGEQANELGSLSTADFEVDDIVVTKKTFGGKHVLSEQVIDWSSPSMLDQAISDMAGQYALATEKYVVDQMAAAVTNTQEVILTSYTDDEEFITDMYLAASSIATTGNYLPNALVMAPGMWAKLGALVDGQGRPVFPQATPFSGIGTLPAGVTGWNGNPLGLNLVVSNQITTQEIGNKDANEYYWLLNTRGVEVYESYKGFLRDESVGTLGVTVAVRGYFAAHVVDVNMIRILGPDATFS